MQNHQTSNFLRQVRELGITFSDNDCIAVFKQFKGDQEQAMNHLLNKQFEYGG
jgi:hypothetical protein